MKCKKCLYTWESRVIEPKACPRCKNRLDYDLTLFKKALTEKNINNNLKEVM